MDTNELKQKFQEQIENAKKKTRNPKKQSRRALW